MSQAAPITVIQLPDNTVQAQSTDTDGVPKEDKTSVEESEAGESGGADDEQEDDSVEKRVKARATPAANPRLPKKLGSAEIGSYLSYEPEAPNFYLELTATLSQVQLADPHRNCVATQQSCLHSAASVPYVC